MRRTHEQKRVPYRRGQRIATLVLHPAVKCFLSTPARLAPRGRERARHVTYFGEAHPVRGGLLQAEVHRVAAGQGRALVSASATTKSVRSGWRKAVTVRPWPERAQHEHRHVLSPVVSKCPILLRCSSARLPCSSGNRGPEMVFGDTEERLSQFGDKWQILNAIREHYLMKREADHGSQLFWDRKKRNCASRSNGRNSTCCLASPRAGRRTPWLEL